MKTRTLLLFCLANSLVLGAALALASREFVSRGLMPASAAGSGIGATRVFFTATQGGDSWGPMLNAIRVHKAGQPVYRTLFFERKEKFQYPLSSLLPLSALAGLGLGEDRIRQLANGASWLAVWATVAATIAIYCAAAGRPATAGVMAVGLVSGLCFYPVMRAYLLGQAQVLLTMLFGVALFLWVRGRTAPAGALIGLMVLVKPQYAAIGLWFALRKRYAALAWSVAVVAAGTAAALWLYGWRESVAYLDVVSYVGKRGDSFYANLSFNGIANHLLFNGPNLIWDAHAYAPYHPWVYAITAVTSVILLALGWWRPADPARRAGAADFAAMAIAATVASPVAWEHHYGILLPIFALVAAQAVSLRARVLAAAAFVLAANSWSPLNALAGTPVLNLLQSLPFAGALGTCWLLRRQDRDPVEEPVATPVCAGNWVAQ